jgi:hypothetical protein
MEQRMSNLVGPGIERALTLESFPLGVACFVCHWHFSNEAAPAA